MKLFIFQLLFGLIVVFPDQSIKKRNFIDTVKLDSIIESHISQDHFAGAVLLISRGDLIIYFKAYGYSKKFELSPQSNCPVRLDTPEVMMPNMLFDLASLTKVFATTFGVMLLVSQNKLSLDDPVSKYIPEFSKNGKEKITIKQLLNHTSGLPEWIPVYYHSNNRNDSYNYIFALPLKYKPGEKRHYSDIGFMILGYIIEKLAQMSLDKFMKENLYKPLGLKNTTFKPLENGIPKDKIVATSHGNPFEYRMVKDSTFGYRVEEEKYFDRFKGWRNYTLQGEVNDGNCFYAFEGISGHAGLFSTASELKILIDLLLNYGFYKGKKIIEPEVVKKFLSKDKFGNGLGWAMDPKILHTPNAPDGTFGHTGFTGTWVVAIPKYKISIIFLTNRQNVGVDKNGFYFDLSPVQEEIFNLIISQISSLKIK